MNDENEAAAKSDFSEVPISAIIVSMLGDGRWYTVTKIRQRLGLHRDIVQNRVANLRLQGYLERAENPAWDGNIPQKSKTARYVYRSTGVDWDGLAKLDNLRWKRPGAYGRYRTSRVIANEFKNRL